MRKISRALISVSDKTGILELASGLASLEVELLSTGGTAKLLREKGLKVRDVSDLTGFPEMLDGRVKTLHPKVHGGLLAIRSNPQHQAQVKEHGIEYIDMVVVNLYPFEKTAHEARRDPGRVDREHRHRRPLHAALGREKFRGCHGSCGRRRLSRGAGRTYRETMAVFRGKRVPGWRAKRSRQRRLTTAPSPPPCRKWPMENFRRRST